MYTITINGKCHKFNTKRQYVNFCKAMTSQSTSVISLGYTSSIVYNDMGDVIRPSGRVYIVNGVTVVFSA